MGRKLIKKNESGFSVLQLIGFILMLLGIVLLIFFSFIPVNDGSIVPSVIAVAFLITMLGVSFAFPSLLEGNEGLSTMRIVVFMVTNVICMLLLKIGWAKGITSLEGIGLNQYWMGVIAFVFGAKATQSFFESRMAVPKEPTKQGMAAVEYSNADVAKLAVAQNEQFLKTKFPNILSVSDAVHDLNETDSHVIALYLKDNNTVDIPDKLEVRMPDGTLKVIATEIVKDLGTGTLHANQFDKVTTYDNLEAGSICCVVKTSNGKQALVTSGHVYSKNTSNDGGGYLNTYENALLNGSTILGKWLFQRINSTEDIALIELNENNNDIKYHEFATKGVYKVTQDDVCKDNIKNATLISNISGSRDGYILDYNTSWSIPYSDGNQLKSNIILIGSSSNRQDSTNVSKKGDSGGCVYHKKTGALIGIILGANSKFTWVLPIKDTIEYWEFELI